MSAVISSIIIALLITGLGVIAAVAFCEGLNKKR